MKRLGVRYPVALDNDYGTWNAYGNKYWPADYLIDQTGRVRHIHFGEGDYDETERDIRLLLKAGGSSRLPPEARAPDRTPMGMRTPESYLGYFRIDRYAGSPVQADRPAEYSFPRTLAEDEFAYDGTWTVESERIVAGENARLKLQLPRAEGLPRPWWARRRARDGEREAARTGSGRRRQAVHARLAEA